MKSVELKNLNIKLNSLAVFRDILNDEVILALNNYLSYFEENTAEAVSLYSNFVSKLYKSGYKSLAAYIKTVVGDNENVYITTIGSGEKPSEAVEECVINELKILQTVADLTPAALRSGIGYDGFLPQFETEEIDILKYYQYRKENIKKFGFGIYASHYMFYLSSENKIVPVQNPDKTRLESLVDYKKEKQIILDNTLALLEGKPAANILLTGDAGTGKSSTIKAVVNELWQKGLRILEVRKEQLREIPAILDELGSNPLKFILFIDDLSFQRDDDNFSALKAVLEGSVSAKAQNIVIYATSNRRHLVKESFSDRDGDEIHQSDTMQEIISLSARFGIHITFNKPNKETYLDIVLHLCKEKGINKSEEEISLLAERYALDKGGRSARAAKQFVDGLLSTEK